MKALESLAVLWLVALPAQAGDTELGAQLPEGARKVAERRYRVWQDWEAVQKFYKQTYGSAAYPRRLIVNQPGIKALHLANASGKGAWEGLNIYQANDEIRIYVVPATGDGKKDVSQPK